MVAAAIRSSRFCFIQMFVGSGRCGARRLDDSLSLLPHKPPVARVGQGQACLQRAAMAARGIRGERTSCLCSSDERAGGHATVAVLRADRLGCHLPTHRTVTGVPSRGRVNQVSASAATRYAPSRRLSRAHPQHLHPAMPAPPLLPSSLLLLAGLLISCSSLSTTVAARELAGGTRPARPAEAAVAAWLERNRERPTALRAFVKRLPKGGDIHSHLSGAVYAESYLGWAAADGYCVDPSKPALVKPSACIQNPSSFPASQLLEKTALYDQLINQWSTRNLPFSGRSGHDQFFAAFAGFEPVSSSLTRQDDMVVEVANRAALQHINYLELMLTVQGSEVRRLGRSAGWDGDAAQTRQRLLSLGLADVVAQGSRDLETLNREIATTLACGTARAQPGCVVTVRFLQQTTRTKPLAEVFAQLLYAFELAKASPSVVGINLVAPEDHPLALRDYMQQMRMLWFLKSNYPDVRISLHAGELTLGLVPPEHLRFHIRQAVQLAQADRIGHGVDVMEEDQPFQLLEEMRKRDLLVEICLTSNEVILNVAGDNHPFADYKRAGVAMALASDDEGISRSDLSQQFLLATMRYKLSYQDLKTLARNSLAYSFLKGTSLWSSSSYTAVQPHCAADLPGSRTPSSRCVSFLASSDRARAQWKLESDFAAFEALPDFQWHGPRQRRTGAQTL